MKQLEAFVDVIEIVAAWFAASVNVVEFFEVHCGFKIVRRCRHSTPIHDTKRRGARSKAQLGCPLKGNNRVVEGLLAARVAYFAYLFTVAPHAKSGVFALLHLPHARGRIYLR